MEIKLLSCPLCAVAHFENVTILRNELINVTKKPLSCPICEEILIGLDKFTIHLFTHCDIMQNQTENAQISKVVSTNTNIYTTNDNNEQSHVNNGIPTTHNYSQDNCQENKNSNNIKENRCELCNFEFTDSSILEMHRNLLHNNGFSCHLCHKKFKMHGSLMVHMRVAHFGFKNKIISSKNDTNITKVETVQKSSCNENESTIIQKTHENKQWECEVCLKKFTTKYFLKKHKRLHTGEMPYECNLCNKSFTFQQSYHKHMLYHSTDKPHSCSECGRSFKELSTLHNHQRIHSGERPFGCETCGKRFRQRISYVVHRRIHTGAMPYKCTACDKSFRYKVSQRTHKCKAQPPGSVVRQFGDLVQKLLQNRTPEENHSKNTEINDSNKPVEPCQDVNTDFFGLVMSPNFQTTSDQFETLCLSSTENEQNNDELFHNMPTEQTPISQIAVQECLTINEECFKQLLYNSHN